MTAVQPTPRLPWRGPFLFSSGPGKRPYYVYTPASYTVGTSVPLLVMLHGCSQTPRGSAIGTQWNDLADEHNMVVVYPGQTIQVLENAKVGSGEQVAEAQLGQCWNDGNGDNCWNWFLPAHQARDAGEPAIIAGIARAVMADTEQWTIDPGRVYVAGMSAGGGMAVIMGATYPDLFSGVAVHSGLEYKAATDGTGAFQVLLRGGPDPVGQGEQAFRAMGDHARSIRVIVIHGSEDQRNIAANGELVVRQWLETNRLATDGYFNSDFTQPTSDDRYGEPVAGGHPYRVRRWKDSAGKVMQEYWTVDGLAHAWSGGYWLGSFADPRGPSATRAMYAFLSRH
ncbi:MAG: extracellular catalytic domain type 1 short-chain-length polyhydroxyalkanoate depolymerase [Pseudonocardiaceae bacterium]